MEGYSATISESSKELTAREQLLVKDISEATKLDAAIDAGAGLIIKPAAYAVVNIHNDKSENKDYTAYVIIDSDGNKYTTSSASFWSSFKEIWDAMEDEGEYEIDIHKKDSKNYTGKQFITCSII